MGIQNACQGLLSRVNPSHALHMPFLRTLCPPTLTQAVPWPNNTRGWLCHCSEPWTARSCPWTSRICVSLRWCGIVRLANVEWLLVCCSSRPLAGSWVSRLLAPIQPLVWAPAPSLSKDGQNAGKRRNTGGTLFDSLCRGTAHAWQGGSLGRKKQVPANLVSSRWRI